MTINPQSIAPNSADEQRPDPHRQAAPRRTLVWVWATVGLCALVFAVGRLFEGFEDDDLQHLHAAWLVGGGMVPYRDYFDHHMPLFHVLMAPLARSTPHDPLALLLISRAVALIPAGLSMWLFCRLIQPREIVPRPAAALIGALGTLLYVVSRHADLVLELRPDYCALPCVLAALVVLAEHVRSPRANLIAGLLVGVAIAFTQKVFALAPAFVVWSLWIAIRAPAGERRQAWSTTVALCAGIALPLTALVSALATFHALPAFLAGPIGMGSHWVQPEKWPIVVQEPVLADFLVFVPGFAWAARSTWLWLRRADDVFSGDALLGLTAVFGTAGFLATPAPTEQAFLLVVQVWVLACAVRQLTAWLTGAVPSLASDRLGLATVVCAAAFTLALLRWYNGLAALVVGLPVAWAAGRIVASSRPLPTRATCLFALLAFIPAGVSAGTAADRMRRAFVLNQVVSMRAIDRLIPPNTRVLTMWPVYTPLREHASYHWFSDPGMYTSTPPHMLEREYLRAMDDPSTSAVVCEPPIVDRLAPDIMRAIRLRFVERPLPRPLRRARLFLRREGSAGPLNLRITHGLSHCSHQITRLSGFAGLARHAGDR